MEVQGHMLAVFRDERGEVHATSAVCKHLGCYVGWNAAEKTWDCPCHGARYDPYGRVLNGPAVDDLERVEPRRPEAEGPADAGESG
jgi:Rieske Fe-S protein